MYGTRLNPLDWTQEDAAMPAGTTHLWEESWDDDDENDDFSKALRSAVQTAQMISMADTEQRRAEETPKQ